MRQLSIVQRGKYVISNREGRFVIIEQERIIICIETVEILFTGKICMAFMVENDKAVIDSKAILPYLHIKYKFE